MVDVSLMCIHFSHFQFSANWYVENIRAELTMETWTVMVRHKVMQEKYVQMSTVALVVSPGTTEQILKDW